MKAKAICLSLVLILLAGILAGCAGTQQTKPDSTASQEPVTLVVAGAWEACPAIDAVGRKFTEQYPNCTVVYEYLQDFEASLEKRMTGDDAVNLFFSPSIQADSAMLPYALELYGRDDLDLSGTFPGLLENFAFREAGAEPTKLYAIPLGAELRGLFVNVTLLKQLNIELPTNQASLLAACAKLKENGYIAFHGNPGAFAQTLLYPWVCNLIANADDPDAVRARIDARGPGLSELFREPFQFMYTLVENGYYDYKKAQTDLGLYIDSTESGYAKDFLNIRETDGVWQKVDDVGQVAFMPSAMTLTSVLNKTKDDYHSSIEYAFMPAPVAPEGGFAYMSPARAIAVNKSSANLDWSVRFLNFLFQPENNELFAQEFRIIPNTQQAFDYISKLFDIPDDRIAHLGEATFGFDFYSAVTKPLAELSKGNNPKYMQQNADGTVSLYPLDHYMQLLEERLTGNEE